MQQRLTADKQSGASLMRTNSRALHLTARCPNLSSRKVKYVKFAYLIRELQCAALTGQTEIILLVEKVAEVGILKKDNTGALCKYTLTRIFSWKG